MRDIIVPMVGRLHRHARIAVLCAILAGITFGAACRNRKPPIVVEDRLVKIENQSERPWRDVRVYLNDHFVAGTPTLEAGGRFHVQQRDFVTAFGQRFDPNRQGAYGVLVTASADGEDIKLVWGQPYKR